MPLAIYIIPELFSQIDDLLFSKLCWHNRLRPNVEFTLILADMKCSIIMLLGYPIALFKFAV